MGEDLPSHMSSSESKDVDQPTGAKKEFGCCDLGSRQQPITLLEDDDENGNTEQNHTDDGVVDTNSVKKPQHEVQCSSCALWHHIACLPDDDVIDLRLKGYDFPENGEFRSIPSTSLNWICLRCRLSGAGAPPPSVLGRKRKHSKTSNTQSTTLNSLNGQRRRVKAREPDSSTDDDDDEFFPPPTHFEDQVDEDEDEDHLADDPDELRLEISELLDETPTQPFVDEIEEEDIMTEEKVPTVAVRKRKKVHLDDGTREQYQARIDRWREWILSDPLEGIPLAEEDDVYANDEGDVWLNWRKDDEEMMEPEDLGGGFVVPGPIWSRLFGYQRTCVKWLSELHAQGAGGIIGDEMGLGKTIQMISFFTALHYGSPDKLDTTNLHSLARPTKRHVDAGAAILIVCPATVIHQWVGEFHKWWPPFRVLVLHSSGSYQGKSNVVDVAAKGGVGHVLVTTYASMRINQAKLLKHQWHYVVLDEGHKIRNPDAEVTLAAKQLRTPHRIILSGSPIQNNLRELWSLFDFTFPGRLGTLPVFMSEFAVPMTQGSYANANPIQVQTAYKCACLLRDIINPYLLRRAKKDVDAQVNLPTKNEQVLFCNLTDDQRFLYEQFLKSKAVDDILHNQCRPFFGIDVLRKLCNHPDLATAVSSIPDYTDPDTPLPWQRSGKMIVVEQLLRLWHENHHRVLLFAQTKQMLTIIESFVQAQEYEYRRMDGGTNIKNRQPLIKEFNNDSNIFIFLLTTRVGGLGVNLIGADRIIIFDPDWNPSTDMQARERAWRIGQTKPVTIYRLLTAGTIEEKIYHRQVFKQLLSNKVLKDPKQRRFFKSNDLYELFTLGNSKNSSTETGALFGRSVETQRKNRKKRKNERKAKKVTSSSSASSSSSISKQKLSPPDGTAENEEHLRFVDHKDTVQAPEPPNNGPSGPKEDYVLNSLFNGTGVHSALKHDQIVDSDAPELIIVEQEAAKVARGASKALLESRKQCEQQALGTPTWTGRFGGKGGGRPRFGFGKSKSGTTSSQFGHGSVSGFTAEKKGPMSSSELLNKIRSRKGEAPTSEGEKPKGFDLLEQMQKFIRSRGNEVTTQMLVHEFRTNVQDQVLFKSLLKELCVFSRPKGAHVGFWELKRQYR
eukprot:m.178669 g.178669  ORF g.178669 m.178669 type:complete len:1122 (-) comp25371_c0_seq1:29-3394(-)